MRGKILGAVIGIVGLVGAANASCFSPADRDLMADLTKNEVAKSYVQRYHTRIQHVLFRTCWYNETSTAKAQDKDVLPKLPQGEGLSLITDIAHGTGRDAWRVLLAYSSVREDKLLPRDNESDSFVGRLSRRDKPKRCIDLPARLVAKRLSDIADVRAAYRTNKEIDFERLCRKLKRAEPRRPPSSPIQAMVWWNAKEGNASFGAVTAELIRLTSHGTATASR